MTRSRLQPVPLSARGVDPKRRRHISIVYGEPQAALGNTVRAALYKEGFQNVAVYHALRPLRDAVVASMPDLLLVDAAMPGGSACDLVRDLRMGRLGSNPFIPVVVTTWQPTPETVHDIVSCGADDLLVKPISPGLLFQRMQMLVDRRKPFVATSEYIGPDRRRPDDGHEGGASIEVPNTLRAKARGEPIDAADLGAAIEAAQRGINEQRLGRNALQMAFLVRVVTPAYLSGAAGTETYAQLEQLRDVAEDTAARLEASRFGAVAPLCQSVLHVAEAIRISHPNPAARDLGLLPRLADAMVAGLNPDAAGNRLAAEIATAVEAYLDRRR